MIKSIKDFFSEQPQCKCKNDVFEVGNMHRKALNCMFCINGNCHYVGDCDRREKEFDGWCLS